MRYVINIWPAAADPGRIQTISGMLASCGTIIQQRAISLNYTGLRNYMVQIYRYEKWAGSSRNHYRGIPAKLNPCYREGRPVWMFELECGNLESLLRTKDRIREFCGIGKHSIHSSDNKEETDLMRSLLTSENTIRLMNRCSLDRYHSFTGNLMKLDRLLKRYGADYRNFVIVSDAVRSLYGLEAHKKLSWIAKTPLPPAVEKKNAREFEAAAESLRSEIFDENMQVIYCGFHFITLEMLNKIHGAEQTGKGG